ncbi:MAG TPA: PDZ domain-containing protein [Phaeodactylibacter sp.]|nr:PDZ domain-containing protein [Phaeodactylibacter sp.]
MKNLFALVFAGMIGGLITLGGVYYFNTSTTSAPPAKSQFATTVSNNNLNIKSGTAVLPFDFSQAAEVTMPSVVHITATQGRSTAQGTNDPLSYFFGNPHQGLKGGTGSGVIYSTDGYIVTNNHVVEGADNLEVTLFDNRTFKAEVVGTDTQTDLAIIKIEATGLPVLKKANSDRAKIGEWVLAVGNPFELNSTVTAGIISAKGRDIDIIKGNSAIESFIQTDAAVNPGNSGGALVDAQGRLLGINTAIATQTGSYAGYSFAIPVNMMTKIAEDIIEFGSYQRGFLGINIADLDNEYADELGLDITQGVVVLRTVDGGAAQYSGLLPNDVITNVNGKKVNSAPELQELIGTKRLGDVVMLTINRNGEIKEISVKLKKG